MHNGLMTNFCSDCFVHYGIKKEFGLKKLLFRTSEWVWFQIQVHVIYMGDKPREASAPYDMHCSMLERILGRSQIIELLNSDGFRIFCLQSSYIFFN